MVIVQDSRPRDWAYMAAFKEKDLPSLEEMVKHIRETHDVDMIESFHKKCEQKLKLSGQTTTLDNGIEIQVVEKTADLVVNTGLQHCINLILWTSGAFFANIIASRNNVLIPPTVTDTALNTVSGGPYAFQLQTSGWSEAKGMKLFYATLVHQDAVTTSMTILNEMGVYNGPIMTNTMLNHEVFFNNQLSRNITPDLLVFANVFILSCVVEFCPVA
jgi:hypothetical protein